MIILDFDDTLFNTHAFKQARKQAVVSLGVTPEQYDQSYLLARNSADGRFVYSDAEHARVLADLGYNREHVFTALQRLTNQIQKFLFADTLTFLDKLHSRGETLVLLSLGDPVFQQAKVVGCGLDRLVDSMYMVDKDKVEIMKDVVPKITGETVWFVNDKISETEIVKKAYPHIQVVLKKSPLFDVEAYQQSGIPFFETLSDIYEFIS